LIEANINFNLSLSDFYDNWKASYLYSLKNKNLIKDFGVVSLLSFADKNGLHAINKSFKTKSLKLGKF